MSRFPGLSAAFLAGLIGGLAACASGAAEQQGRQAVPATTRAISDAEREVYSVVLAHAFDPGRRDTLFLVAESPVYHDLPSNNFLRRGKAIVPAPLPARLTALSAAGPPVAAEAFPPPRRVLSAASARRLATERLGGLTILAVTPVAFADDSAQALMYYEIRCGNLCGGGYEVWLVRGRDGRWSPRQEMIHWIS